MDTWQKGRDRQGAGQERGAEMCSLAVAEDVQPVVTPAPHACKRDQFRAALRAQRGCYKICQGIPKLHQNPRRGDGGEQTETRAQGWSNPVG